MQLHPRSILLSAALAWSVTAAPTEQVEDKRSIVERDGITYHVFEHAATGAKIEFVKNSGICGTTPGVNQYSGYLSVGTGMDMWFWFFEARNNASNAPLAAWFNGGPGCSSMIGLFQENGPCHFVNGEETPSLNNNSFNNFANMLYIDQPIGVGFSYGVDNATSTKTAAPYVWKLLQAFYAQFPEYESRDFAIFTESYGGHYGPEFTHYIRKQNDAIKTGMVDGENINMIALGINNGWFDSAIQEKAYIDYAYNNTYRQLINVTQRNSLLDFYANDCLPAVEKCTQNGSNQECENASTTCGSEIEQRIIDSADFDVYDVRQPSNDPYPPATYSSYLQKADVVKAIGAKTAYQECSYAVSSDFQGTGDASRTYLDTLSAVVQSGIRVLLWAGDADWICNYKGVQKVAEMVDFPGITEFGNAQLQSYTVNGEKKGEFKTVDNFSYLRVYGAGHEVPYYQPQTALQVFEQTIKKMAISST
ncbi:hypothetical protein DTO164E3_7339 [Paecilomyces variotii]|nr:hypothetical protein DTO164E3_7339 [Paecilomyces variotii]KAJ9208155.1 hypothetical protein DTO032I3_826 [Paecilomyces variotii]KAJ9282111.1 hypothetical protein DTO021D3_863 [Paecilomyces variotii]KAJ9343549.1 hypothetical protein DTO027B6_3767 [Paecilomyces variotii]KAJ9383020.1 hypothetical protein DTO032I4_5287 [Paecilomyces variotii]